MALYIKPTPGRIAFNIINYILLSLLACITLYPFLYVLANSLSSQIFIQQGKVGIIPVGFNLEAYKRVLEFPLIGRAYLNTVFYTTAGVAINMLLTVCGAYPLSRQRFPGKKFFMIMITITLIYNGGIIPTFIVVKSLGMYNTLWAVLVPFAINSWYLILMKSFFEQIPQSLEESALIDGANEVQVLFKIILPLSKPALMTIALFYAVLSWNAFFTAMIYLKDKEMHPIQLILRQIVILNETDEMLGNVTTGKELVSESVKHATIIVATLPILLVYPFIQKYFVKGVMVGAVKG